MADNTSSNSDLLSQLLMLLKNQQGTSTTTLPNQSMNNAGQVFQLGANGQATPENPGSSPDASFLDSNNQYVGPVASKVLNGGSAPSYWSGSLPTFGATAPPNDQSVGGKSYGNAGMGGFVNSPQEYANYQGALNTVNTNQNSSDLNQLLQGLLKDKNLTQPPPTMQPAAQVPPLPPPVPDNQAAYTPPSQAQAPGMGNLATQLQNGMSQKSIIAQGGPLQASTGSNLQFGAPYDPGVATSNGVVQPQATSSPLDGVAGSASIPTNAFSAYHRVQQLQDQGFSPATKTYSPSLQSGTYNATNPMPGPTSSGKILNTAQDPDPDPGLEGTGIQPGGMSAQGAGIATALGSGAAQIGQSVANSFRPIKLAPVPQVQQPRPPLFSGPQMQNAGN